MHGKENIVRQLLENSLGVNVTTPRGFDTDHFGTFSGEVERVLSPLDTARKKCDEAHRLTGETLVLASEGSFGAHPVMSFVPANEELLVLKDFLHGREFKAKVLSTDTNFAGNEYPDIDDALYFLTQVDFPSHAVIMSGSKDDKTEFHKGIRDWQQLKASFAYFQKRFGKVYIQTDMRAHLNPLRQKVIGEACEKLVAVLRHTCPICEAPGFSITEGIEGLPCQRCEAPTKSARIYRYHCQHCRHTAEAPVPGKKQKEDPMYCQNCNP
jgi:hypothetical protein